MQAIHFVNDELIDTENLVAAHKLCKEIDPKDMIFVALTFQVDGLLWTRDEALKQGLTKKGFLHFFEP